MGTMAVPASRYAVVTQAYRLMPFRSATMRGSEVATMV